MMDDIQVILDTLLSDAIELPSTTAITTTTSNSNDNNNYVVNFVLANNPNITIPISVETCLKYQKQQGDENHYYSIIVGRQASVCDLRIQHTSISRKHAILYYNTAKQLMVYNLSNNTKNGITVTRSTNNSKMNVPSKSSTLLQHNDSIMFGTVRENSFIVKYNGNHCNSNDNNIVNQQEQRQQEQTPKQDEQQSQKQPNGDAITLTNDDDTQEQQQQRLQKDNELIMNAGIGLTGRAKRIAEIDAMMSSLNDDNLNYNYNTTRIDNNDNTNHTEVEPPNQQQQNSDKDDNNDDPFFPVIQKYKLPISYQYIIMNNDDDSDASSKRSHTNSITCLSMNSSGSCFAIGCTDYYLRIYDFGTMNFSSSRQYTKKVAIEDGHWPIDCCFCTTTSSSNDGGPSSGTKLVVATTSSQPTILSLNDATTENNTKFVRGDMYVTDPTKTIGHTGMATGIQSYPIQYDLSSSSSSGNIVLSSSIDGSVRVWDIIHGTTQFNNTYLVNDTVIGIKNSKGHKTAVSTIQFHPSGREVAIGTACGTIQLWTFNILPYNSNKSKKQLQRDKIFPKKRPDRIIIAYNNTNKNKSSATTGNIRDTPIHSIQYNFDGSLLVSRCNSTTNDNDSVKVWNNNTQSKLNRSQQHREEPVFICQGIVSSTYEQTNCTFSPNGKLLIAPTTTTTTGGFLNIYDVSFESDNGTNGTATKLINPILSLPIMNCIPIIVKWHPKINQILIGCSNGQIIVLYDTQYNSTKGILVPLSKAGSSRLSNDNDDDGLIGLLRSRAAASGSTRPEEIITPNYRDDIQNKRRKTKDEWKYQDNNDINERTSTSTMPERPSSFQHKMDIVQTGGNATTFQQYVSDQSTANNKHDKSSIAHKIIAGKDPREALFQYSTSDDAIVTKQTKELLANITVEEEEEQHHQQNPQQQHYGKQTNHQAKRRK